MTILQAMFLAFCFGVIIAITTYLVGPPLYQIIKSFRDKLRQKRQSLDELRSKVGYLERLMTVYRDAAQAAHRLNNDMVKKIGELSHENNRLRNEVQLLKPFYERLWMIRKTLTPEAQEDLEYIHDVYSRNGEAPKEPEPKKEWVCPRCGRDRLKEPCDPVNFFSCPMVAVPHGHISLGQWTENVR